MVNKEMFCPAGSEITSPLAEHLAAFVMTTRAHVVGMLDNRSGDDDERQVFMVHATSALSTLEMLTELIGGFVFESKVLPE